MDYGANDILMCYEDIYYNYTSIFATIFNTDNNAQSYTLEYEYVYIKDVDCFTRGDEIALLMNGLSVQSLELDVSTAQQYTKLIEQRYVYVIHIIHTFH